MREEAQPIVELKQMVQPVRPISSKISALNTRDNLVGGKFCYQMVNTYNFNVVSLFVVNLFGYYLYFRKIKH